MSNLHSNQVRVFPTTNRETYDPAAKFTTEYNLTSLINKLLDTKAFVVTDNLSFDQNDSGILNILEFNIMGYYFFIEKIKLADIDGEGNYLNASLQIGEAQYQSKSDGSGVDSTLNNWWQLDGGDDFDTDTSNYTYTGLNLTWSDQSIFNEDNESFARKDTNTGKVNYTFTILKRLETGEYQIPPESKIKFETKADGSKHSLKLDDGII